MRLTAAAATSPLALRRAAAPLPRDRGGAAAARPSAPVLRAKGSPARDMAPRRHAVGANPDEMLDLTADQRVTIG
jgi:hypothetical protein